MSDAYDLILDALAEASDNGETKTLEEVADKLLTALAAAGLTITETRDAEWGYRQPWRDGTYENPTGKTEAQDIVDQAKSRGWEGWELVCRTPAVPAGPWEVAP